MSCKYRYKQFISNNDLNNISRIFCSLPPPNWIWKALRDDKLIVLIRRVLGYCDALAEGHTALEEKDEQRRAENGVIKRPQMAVECKSVDDDPHTLLCEVIWMPRVVE